MTTDLSWSCCLTSLYLIGFSSAPDFLLPNLSALLICVPGAQSFRPSLDPPECPPTLCQGRRCLHPPPTDPAPSVNPSDHNNTGKKGNHCSLIRKRLLCVEACGNVCSATAAGHQPFQLACVLVHWAFLRSSNRYCTAVGLNMHA